MSHPFRRSLKIDDPNDVSAESETAGATGSQRRLLLVGREDEVGPLQSLLFRYDPIGINFETNTDEYRPEAESIAIRRREAKTLDDLTAIVHAEFSKWFSPAIAGPKHKYEVIAREIWAGWTLEQFRSPSTFTRPSQTLRIWSIARGDLFLKPDEIGIEWSGQLGHPSSYALLMGRKAPARRINLRYFEDSLFAGSLAMQLDTVRWELPQDYAPFVLGALDDGIEVTIAAHGEFGSSIRAFQKVARMLSVLLSQHHSHHHGDADIWACWVERSRMLPMLPALRDR